jgi:Sulfatase-modifying factor enzyme 1
LEDPPHEVTIAKTFAVGRTEVTFAEWDICVAEGACLKASDSGWGRGDRPVINVSWDDAKEYVAWLSRITGKDYRLLSEAEWEYAARAGTTTPYSWGDNIGKGNANCRGCDSQWDGKQTAPVGSFKPNAFGLYDMHGNVIEWVEDRWHESYGGAPTDGTAWLQDGDASRPIVRGGSWVSGPQDLRALPLRELHRLPGRRPRFPVGQNVKSLSLPLYVFGPGRSPGPVFGTKHDQQRGDFRFLDLSRIDRHHQIIRPRPWPGVIPSSRPSRARAQ